MAVEARHANFFNPDQLLTNRDFMKIQASNYSACNTQINYGVPATNTPTPEQIFSFGQSVFCDPTSAKSSMNKSELSCLANSFAVSRKRQRDCTASTFDFDSLAPAPQKLIRPDMIVDQELVSQMNQHQSEIDRLIAHHTQKLKVELEGRRQQQWRALTSAFQSAVTKKLREKDEEIQRMEKLNWVLQERLKSLYVENQLWRDLAHTNEAAANTLRSNLDHVLASASAPAAGGGGDQDAESSCCGSTSPETEGGDLAASGRRVVGVAQDKRGWCRGCGERQASVLVLPCRHLCLCTVCGSSLLKACPVCDTATDASVHVDMS